MNRDLFILQVRTHPCGCWTYGNKTLSAYGHIDGEPAHRVSYELFVGPIPADLVIDHLCQRKGCCNPRHLEAVTGAENTRRAAAIRMGNQRLRHAWLIDQLKADVSLNEILRRERELVA